MPARRADACLGSRRSYTDPFVPLPPPAPGRGPPPKPKPAVHEPLTGCETTTRLAVTLPALFVPVAVTPEPTATSAVVPATVSVIATALGSVTVTLLVFIVGVAVLVPFDVLFFLPLVVLVVEGRWKVVDLTTILSPFTETTGPEASAKFAVRAPPRFPNHPPQLKLDLALD